MNRLKETQYKLMIHTRAYDRAHAAPPAPTCLQKWLWPKFYCSWIIYLSFFILFLIFNCIFKLTCLWCCFIMVDGQFLPFLPPHRSEGRPPLPVKYLSSQLTHCKFTWNLTASSFWSHSSASQRTHEMISQLWPSCESSVSLHLTPWAWLWPICEINHAVVAVWSLWCDCRPHGETFRRVPCEYGFSSRLHWAPSSGTLDWYLCMIMVIKHLQT